MGYSPFRSWGSQSPRLGEPDLSKSGGSGGTAVGANRSAWQSCAAKRTPGEPPLTELLPDADRWRTAYDEIFETYRREGAFPAMGRFGAVVVVEEGGPKYSEEMQNAPSTPEGEAMGQRMVGNFDLFLAHELKEIVSYRPDVDALSSAATRIVPAAGERSGEQPARRATFALAELLGTPVASQPGAHGGWGSDPQAFAERLDEILQEA